MHIRCDLTSPVLDVHPRGQERGSQGDMLVKIRGSVAHNSTSLSVQSAHHLENVLVISGVFNSSFFESTENE